jgi:hypothetical protein
MSKTATHPSDISYAAGREYAEQHGEVESYIVTREARMNHEDQEAFIDGYWDYIHNR